MRAPCGCRAALEAEQQPDEETREILRDDAKQAALAWRCPRVCRSREPLDADHTEALANVRRLTGHEFKSCPLSGTWDAWAHRAVDAEEHGLTEDRAMYGPPPRALVDAVRVIRRARRDRDAAEKRTQREERDHERSK